jgi:Tol biopolymer transport system component
LFVVIMIHLKKLYLFLLLLAVAPLFSCDDSLPGAPFFVIPPGPNGNIVYTQINPLEPFSLKSDLYLVDSNGNRVLTLGAGAVLSKPGKDVIAWTIFNGNPFETQLWQGSKSGGTPSQVSPAFGIDEFIVPGSAAISSDGRKVAFATYNATLAQATLYYYVAGNGWAPTPTAVAKNFAPNTIAAFSPDGNKLAYFTQNLQPNGDGIVGTEGFVIADVSTTNVIPEDLTPLLPPFLIDGNETIDWSPDGQKLQFSAGGYEYLYSFQDRNPSFSSYVHGAFSPDGKQIAYIATDNQLWVESVESGRTQMTNAIDSGAYYPCWSPDGKKIVFTSLKLNEDVEMACLKSVDLSNPLNPTVLTGIGAIRGFWMTR